jgi:hypothetical protein
MPVGRFALPGNRSGGSKMLPCVEQNFFVKRARIVSIRAKLTGGFRCE